MKGIARPASSSYRIARQAGILFLVACIWFFLLSYLFPAEDIRFAVASDQIPPSAEGAALAARGPRKTRTPTLTRTMAPSRTPTPTNPTATSVPPSSTPTQTPLPATATPTYTPTDTPLPPTGTPTNTPTNTPVPATATPTYTPTDTPLPPTSTPSSTPTPNVTDTPTPTATPTRAEGGGVLVLCDGQTYDGYTTKLFVFETATHQDPGIQKVIRNCVFRNSTLPPIVIKNAKNVLIEGNTFENIRTNQPGIGVHAINIPCRAAASCTSDNGINNITIRGNTFRYIGADGIQIGEEAPYISDVDIRDNEFVGRDDVGESAVDVKGVDGPIVIAGNRVHGFRPCESPKSLVPGTQDCSGSNGSGIVVHEGGAVVTSAHNVTLENNNVYDNTVGLILSSGVQNITVRGNQSFGNLSAGIVVNSIYSVAVTENILTDNPTHIKVKLSPLAGGSCMIRDNTFAGSGVPLVLESSTCE